MTKAVESGMPKLKIEESAARRQARIDRGEEVIVGVNKYRAEGTEKVDILDIDNSKGREQQVARLAQIRTSRDGKRAPAAPPPPPDAAPPATGNPPRPPPPAARPRAP